MTPTLCCQFAVSIVRSTEMRIYFRQGGKMSQGGWSGEGGLYQHKILADALLKTAVIEETVQGMLAAIQKGKRRAVD